MTAGLTYSATRLSPIVTMGMDFSVMEYDPETCVRRRRSHGIGPFSLQDGAALTEMQLLVDVCIYCLLASLVQHDLQNADPCFYDLVA